MTGLRTGREKALLELNETRLLHDRVYARRSLLLLLTHVTRHSPEHVLGFFFPFPSTSLLLTATRLMPVSHVSLLDGMDPSLSSSCHRTPIEAAPSWRIWPHSDQQGCIRNLRESPCSLPYPHLSAGPTSLPASFRNYPNHNRPG